MAMRLLAQPRPMVKRRAERAMNRPPLARFRVDRKIAIMFADFIIGFLRRDETWEKRKGKAKLP